MKNQRWVAAPPAVMMVATVGANLGRCGRARGGAAVAEPEQRRRHGTSNRRSEQSG